MRSVGVEERRARLARRHRITPGLRAASVEDAAAATVCLHGTDPATVYLSARARTDDFDVADLDRALYDDRTLIKVMAMRRTVFVVPRDLVGVVQSAAGDRVAASESRKLIRDVQREGLHADGEHWLRRAKQAVMAALADGREATSSELRDELTVLRGSMLYGKGKSWGGEVPVGPRVLTVLAAEGKIVRAGNRGGWTISRPNWAAMDGWLGVPMVSDPNGHTALVRAWLYAFGPGTRDDIKWWLGSTATAVKNSLAELGAVEVDLDGRTGCLLPDDLDEMPAPEPWVALLPSLDPTTMGWADRHWYLGGHRNLLFDRNGNAGPTLWSDGRIVGGWWQAPDGEVIIQLLEDTGTQTERALRAEADRLTGWLAGTVVIPRFPSPLAKAVAS